MVNTESFDAFSPSSGLRQVLAAAVGAFVTRLGECLAEEAGLESLCRISNLPEPRTVSDLLSMLEELESILGSSLVSDFALVMGFRALNETLVHLSSVASSHLAGRARRHLNVVSALPPMASDASFLIEQIALGALVENARGEMVRTKWSEVLDAAQKKLASIDGRERVRIHELGTFLSSDLAQCLRWFVHLSCGACENLAAVVVRACEPVLGPRTPSEGDTLHGIGAFERRRAEVQRLGQTLDRLRQGESWRQARQSSVTGRLVGSLVWLDLGLQDVDGAIEALRSIEPMEASAQAPQRIVEAENYLYVKALARHLIVAGESPRDVEKLSASFFDYASKNGVACAEVLDEEILALHLNIRRDSLVKARLEIRLNDVSFPLSVAHKDWILRSLKGL